MRILAEAARIGDRGAIAALLRREGLYASHLSSWRQQLRDHGEAGLDPKPSGRRPIRAEHDRQIDRLTKKNHRLERDLLVARKLIELAGKAHEILGVALPSLDNDEGL